jgi:hypothetical protein
MSGVELGLAIVATVDLCLKYDTFSQPWLVILFPKKLIHFF